MENRCRVAPREYHEYHEKTGRLVRKDKIYTDEEKKEFNTHLLLAAFVGSGKGPGSGLRKEDNTSFQPSYLAKLEYQCEFFLQTQCNLLPRQRQRASRCISRLPSSRSSRRPSPPA